MCYLHVLRPQDWTRGLSQVAVSGMIPSAGRAWSLAVSKSAVRRCCLPVSRASHSRRDTQAAWDPIWKSPALTKSPTPKHDHKAKAKGIKASFAKAPEGGGLAGHLVCKCCNSSMTDEDTFLKHLAGKPHYKKSGGMGFCGLLPNAQAPSQARLGNRKDRSIKMVVVMLIDQMLIDLQRKNDERGTNRAEDVPAALTPACLDGGLG